MIFVKFKSYVINHLRTKPIEKRNCEAEKIRQEKKSGIGGKIAADSDKKSRKYFGSLRSRWNSGEKIYSSLFYLHSLKRISFPSNSA